MQKNKKKLPSVGSSFSAMKITYFIANKVQKYKKK